MNPIKKVERFLFRKGIDPYDLIYIGISFAFLIFVISIGIASLFA
jgi:hypothetical protein|tara:strand:- start:9988 stop:10122 length:135 start_codon:yes stop_codon:yes gene_type:complete